MTNDVTQSESGNEFDGAHTDGAHTVMMDRMVDGELSADEQRGLLLACEEQGRWRELALTYVESQVLGDVLGDPALLDEDTTTSETSMVPRTSRPRESSRQSREHWNVMPLAAAVLLSLGLGYGLGWWWQADDGAGGGVQIADESDGALTAPIPTVVKNKVETVPYYIEDTFNGKRQFALPVVQASDLGPNWQERLRSVSLPKEVVREYRSKGMNVRHRRTMERVQLEDGRVMFVPTDYFYEELFP